MMVMTKKGFELEIRLIEYDDNLIPSTFVGAGGFQFAPDQISVDSLANTRLRMHMAVDQLLNTAIEQVAKGIPLPEKLGRDVSADQIRELAKLVASEDLRIEIYSRDLAVDHQMLSFHIHK